MVPEQLYHQQPEHPSISPSLAAELLPLCYLLSALGQLTLLWHHSWVQSRKREAAMALWSSFLVLTLFLGKKNAFLVSPFTPTYFLFCLIDQSPNLQAKWNEIIVSNLNQPWISHCGLQEGFTFMDFKPSSCLKLVLSARRRGNDC